MRHETRTIFETARKPGALAAMVLTLAGAGIKPVEAYADSPKAAESALSHESKSPEPLLGRITARMQSLSKKIDASPHKYLLKKSEYDPNAFIEGFKPYLISTPGSQPGHYDLVIGELTNDTQHELPRAMLVILNANSNRPYHIKSYQRAFELQTFGTKFSTPKDTVELVKVGLTSEGKTVKSAREYRVSAVNEDIHTPGVISYPQNPRRVAQEYDLFFKSADQVLKESSSD